MTISVRDHPAGYATLTQSLQKDGSKNVDLRIELTTANRTIKLDSQARYDPKGFPTRKFQETLGGGVNRQVVVTFGAGGATVVTLDSGKRTVKNVSLVSAAPWASLSEYWFIRDMPKPGQTEQTYQFNTDTLEWELVRTEYRGKKTLTFEGHSIPVYEVVTKRGDKVTTSLLDSKGLPVLVDQGDAKLTKIWPK